MPAGDARPRWASRPTRIREDRRFVTGRGRYVADITPPGTLHVGLVTSPYAHARIVSIDRAEALELDGVACVLTGAELAKVTEPLRQYLPLPAVQRRPLPVGGARYGGGVGRGRGGLVPGRGRGRCRAGRRRLRAARRRPRPRDGARGRGPAGARSARQQRARPPRVQL